MTKKTGVFIVPQGPQKTSGIKAKFSSWLQDFFESIPFNIVLATLILTSVALVFLEFLLPEGPDLDQALFLNHVITIVFIVELSLRFYCAPNKKIFFSNFWVDILSVIPAFRLFRTLRVFRLLRLLRFSRAAIILLAKSGWLSHRAATSVTTFGVLLLTAVLLVFCGTLTTLVFEVHHSQTIPLSLFAEKVWETAFLFMSGELLSGLPQTLGGKVSTLLISLSGLVVFAILVGVVTASLSNYFKTKMDAKDMTIQDLSEHVVICGWERIARTILNELEQQHNLWRNGVVLIAETDLDIVREAKIKNPNTFFHVNKDFTQVENLEAAGIKKARTAIVLSDKGKAKALRDQDRDARTVLTCLTIEKLNPTVYTVAELLNDENGEHLRMAGVEEIISRTGLTGTIMAASAINQGVSDIIQSLTTTTAPNRLQKIQVPDIFVGKPVLDALLFLKQQHSATLLSIERPNDKGKYESIINPAADIILASTDHLTILTAS